MVATLTQAYGHASTTAEATVVNCYDLLDPALGTGVHDFTEGMYFGDPSTPYEEAQQNQAEHVLHLAHCRRGSRLLDVGCGYGRILETAKSRGAIGRGITLSRPQMEYCRRRGLNAWQLDYRNLPHAIDGEFDCVVANGSIEHFVQAEDAADGRAHEIYSEMFDVFHRMLDPGSESGRLVTTLIHFGDVVIDPRDMLHPPSHFPRGSSEQQFALLVRTFGGFYPQIGELEACASGRFALIDEEDGTDDYLYTSEHWLESMQNACWGNLQFLAGAVGNFVRHPSQALTMLDCLLVAQSWNWQFRGEPSPMKLLRQTWLRLP